MQFSISSKLATIVIVVLPVLTIFTIAAGVYLKSVRKLMSRKEDGWMQLVQERFANIAVVRAFGQEEKELDDFVEVMRDLLDAKHWVAAIHGGFHFAVREKLLIT